MVGRLKLQELADVFKVNSAFCSKGELLYIILQRKEM